MTGDQDDKDAYIFSKRRDDQSRRVDSQTVEQDQRLAEDRREDGDRRGFYVNLVSPAEEFYNEVITWLMENGEDRWTIGPNENEPDDSEVTCRVRFESNEKLQAFQSWLNSKK